MHITSCQLPSNRARLYMARPQINEHATLEARTNVARTEETGSLTASNLLLPIKY